MKNCDLGLENAARGLRPLAAFSRPRSQFFTIRTDPKPANNIYSAIKNKYLPQVEYSSQSIAIAWLAKIATFPLCDV